MLDPRKVDSSWEAQASHEVAELIELDPRVREGQGPFEFWYRLTAPPRQPLSARFELREAARQGHLTSTVLAMIAGTILIQEIPASFATRNPALLYVAAVLLTTITIALFLNRIGKGFIGRLLVVIVMTLSLYASFITYTGGLTTNALPNMDILVVEPTLVALVLLPPSSAFYLALCNMVFLALDFYFEHHAPDLQLVLASDGYATITRPFYLAIFVLVVVYPVMRSVLRAIALGDRAKEIAKVQRDLANREAAVVLEKQQLDEEISQLVDALAQIGNGTPQARIPFPTSPALHPISGAINNLYTRIRSARQREYELQHTKQAAIQLIEAIRTSKRTRRPLRIEHSGNPIIDAIALELLKEQTVAPPSSQEDTGYQWGLHTSQ